MHMAKFNDKSRQFIDEDCERPFPPALTKMLGPEQRA